MCSSAVLAALEVPPGFSTWDSAELLLLLTSTKGDELLAVPDRLKDAPILAVWTVSQAGFALTLLWASRVLYRIIKYLLEMGEGKVELDALLIWFSSSLKAENTQSEVPVIDEVFSSQYQRRAWEQDTQSILPFRNLSMLFTLAYLQKGRAFLNAWLLPKGFQGTNIL